MTTTAVALLITLAVVAASITLSVGISALHRRSGSPGPAPVDDLMEVAFLNGGPSRVVDTVLTTMYSDGRLAIGAPGVVSAQSTVAHDPVERSVYAELAAAPNGALHTLRYAVMRGAAVQEIGDSLAFRGLMVPPQAGRKWRAGSIVLLLACILGLPATLVAAVMVAFAGNSAAPFVAMVLPAMVLGIVCGAVNAGRAGARVTPAGRRAAGAYAVSHADRTGAGHLVAVRGLRALPDRDLWEQLRTAARLTPGGSRTTSRTASTDSGTGTTYAATAMVWCAGSVSGASSCGSSSGDSGSGSGGSSCSSGSGGSSCGSSSGSSCGSSSGSSCGGGSSCGSSS